MKVFVFDLVPYDENLDYLKNGGKELPYPLPATHFKPAVAARVYREHLEAWEELDRLGFDGVGFNEHHCSPYGLMNSPNLLAAAAAQRTKKLKLLIYGNLLPLHQPLRLAEELAMLDCMSEGRIISGFVRGIPREYQVHNVPLPDSRPRFEEAMEIILRAWQEDIFSYEGKYWNYKDVALWPRPFQRPHPPIWMPITGSKETIEFAAKRNIPITPGVTSKGLLDDVIAYYDKCLIAAGHTPSEDSISIPIDAYIADSKAQAIREASPYALYFNRTLFSHGNITETNLQRAGGYVSDASNDYVRPENLGAAARAREDYRDLDETKLARRAENMPWGPPDEVAERIIATAEHAGASTVLVSLNRGAMPQEMFLNQIRRFGTEVLPRLQAHRVKPRSY